MIITSTLMIGGEEFTYTRSDAGRYVVRDGISYEEAYDPTSYGRTYTEGDVIRSDESDESGEILDILLGGSDD